AFLISYWWHSSSSSAVTAKNSRSVYVRPNVRTAEEDDECHQYDIKNASTESELKEII
ncbi:hypothetical protein E4U58_001674, partial [Claviceps cyperi]